MKTKAILIGLMSLLVGAPSVHAFTLVSPVFSGPTPYLSVTDSPFKAKAGFTVETFEDGLMNVPGVVLEEAGSSVASGNPTIDSVDADDGVIDGVGTSGHSLYSGAALHSFTFDFTGSVLPTYAGIVWTDVGLVLSGLEGRGDVLFEAFGTGDVSLGTVTGTNLGNGVATGETAEDRFFGVEFAGGISKIKISMANSIDWEVDHLQFQATPVPLPAAVWLLGSALVGLARRRG